MIKLIDNSLEVVFFVGYTCGQIKMILSEHKL